MPFLWRIISSSNLNSEFCKTEGPPTTQEKKKKTLQEREKNHKYALCSQIWADSQHITDNHQSENHYSRLPWCRCRKHPATSLPHWLCCSCNPCVHWGWERSLVCAVGGKLFWSFSYSSSWKQSCAKQLWLRGELRHECKSTPMIYIYTNLCFSFNYGKESCSYAQRSPCSLF